MKPHQPHISMTDKSVAKAVGQQVKLIRQRQGWKQDALADAMGISRTTMSNIERGAQRIFVDQLYHIALILQVELGELLPSAGDFKQDEAMVRAAADDPLTPDALLHLQEVIEQVTVGLKTKKVR